MTAPARHLAAVTDRTPPSELTGEDGQRQYTAPQLCALTGVSYREVDYWTRCDLLHAPAPGSGRQRLYDADELDVLQVVAALLRTGFSLRTAFEVARHLLDHDEYVRPLADIYELTIRPITPEEASP